MPDHLPPYEAMQRSTISVNSGTGTSTTTISGDSPQLMYPHSSFTRRRWQYCPYSTFPD